MDIAEQRRYYKTAAINLLLSNYLAEILKIFSRHNIRVIVLKGMDFIHNLYADIGMRPMSDIDILVKPEDLQRVHIILSELGYAAPRYTADMFEFSSPSSLNTVMYNLEIPDKPAVHVHWHLINTTWPVDSAIKYVDISRIWEHAQPIHIVGEPAFRLCPEHLLLYLAVHNLNHFFAKNILQVDIEKTLRAYKDNFDWDFFVAETRRFHLSFIVYCSLFRTCRNQGLYIEQLERLIPLGGFNRGQRIIGKLLDREKNDYLFCCLCYWIQEKGLLRKLSFGLRLVFPRRLVMAHSLNCRAADIRISDYLQRIFRR